MSAPRAGNAVAVNGPADGGSGRLPSPVVVGGLGGSGTRLIAGMLSAEGYFLGADLNEAWDNLWFTLLFKRPGALGMSDAEFARRLRLFLRAMAGGEAFSTGDRELLDELAAAGWEQHQADWLQVRVATLLSRANARSTAGSWGWKEPNTHVYLDRLDAACPGMRYVFVSRHGLDMAISGNQNQARLWGAVLLGEEFSPTPRYSLRYWCAAHRRTLAAAAALGDRFLFLRYDDLCRHPERELEGLAAFLGVRDAPAVARLRGMVVPPSSLQRSKHVPRSAFDAADVAYVESLGFVVDDAASR